MIDLTPPENPSLIRDWLRSTKVQRDWLLVKEVLERLNIEISIDIDNNYTVTQDRSIILEGIQE